MKEHRIIEKLEAIEKTLFDIYMNKRDLEIMLESKTEIKENVLSNHHVFGRIRFNIVRIIVINLYKLFETKGNYSFTKIINLLRSQNKSSKLNREKKIIDELENKIHEIKNREEFSIVNTLRSKFYAHLDNNRFNENHNISFNQLKDIVNETRILYDKFNSVIKNTTFLFDHGGVDSIAPLLASLNKYDQIKKEARKQNRIHSECIETKIVLEIIRRPLK
jgi:hypothetical protein